MEQLPSVFDEDQLIQGSKVSEWTRSVKNWLNRLILLNDKFNIRNQFATQFLAVFMDIQRNQKARTELQNLQMRWALISQYTMDFKRLVQEVGYQSDTPKCIYMFMSGLPIKSGHRCFEITIGSKNPPHKPIAIHHLLSVYHNESLT